MLEIPKFILLNTNLFSFDYAFSYTCSVLPLTMLCYEVDNADYWRHYLSYTLPSQYSQRSILLFRGINQQFIHLSKGKLSLCQHDGRG